MTAKNALMETSVPALNETLPPSVRAWLQQADRAEIYLSTPTPPIAEDVLRAAISTIEKSLTPATPKEIAECLQWLRMVTVSRETDPIDLGKVVAIFSLELGSHSAEVWSTAVREYAHEQRWWPALADLSERMSAITGRRKVAIARLKWAIKRQAEEAETDAWREKQIAAA